MPKYPENLIHFCRPVLEHYELKDEMGRMFVRSMLSDRGDGEAVATMCGKGLGYLPWPSGHVPRERA